LIIRKVKIALQDKDLEHQQFVKWGTTSFALVLV